MSAAVDAWLAVLELARHEGDQEGDMKEVAENLVKQGLTPVGVEGLSSGDIEELGRGFAKFLQRALLKRCLGQQETLREAKKARMVEAPAQLALTNQPQSALDLAGVLNPTQPRLPAVDVSALLSEANLAKTPQSGLPAVALFQKLQDASAAAKALQRNPFIYIELTAKDVLPDWLPPDAVGGKLQMAGDEIENASLHTQTLSDIAAALKSATTAPRYFRTTQQWTGAFVRYAIAAIPCGHLTIVGALGHMQTISRISEEARNIQAHHVALAVCYDELRRRSWEARAARNDVSLDIDAEAWLVDRETLDLAKARLDQVVAAAGLRRAPSAQTSSQPLAAEAALAKSTAAAEAITKRAEQAIARLQSAKSPNSNNKGGKGGRRTERSMAFNENKQRYDDRRNDDSRGKGGDRRGDLRRRGDRR